MKEVIKRAQVGGRFEIGRVKDDGVESTIVVSVQSLCPATEGLAGRFE